MCTPEYEIHTGIAHKMFNKMASLFQLCYEFCVRQAREHRHKIRETLVYPTGVQATINVRTTNVEMLL